MQVTDTHFIQNKIASIGTALLFCDDQCMLPFPAYMVTALKTDDRGCIWFFISRSGNKPVSYDRTSAASLDFYRKGHPFSMKIDGQLSLVNDQAMMRDFMKDLIGNSIPVKAADLSGVLLVKVQIEYVEYKELVPRKLNQYLRHIVSVLKNVWNPVHTSLQPSL